MHNLQCEIKEKAVKLFRWLGVNPRTWGVVLCMLGMLGSEQCVAQINTDYFMFDGYNSMSKNKFTEAIKSLNVVIRYNPDNYEAYFLRGMAKYNLGDFRGSLEDIDKTLEINPVFSHGYHYRAITKDRLYDYNSALSDFEKALELAPIDADIYLNRGITRMQMKDYGSALTDFNTSIKYNGHSALAYLSRGMAKYNLNDTVSAISDFNLAIKENYFFVEAYLKRGIVNYELKNYKSAIADMNQAVKIDPDNPSTYYNRAISNMQMKDTILALKDFDNVLRLDPYNALTYYNRAIIYVQQERYEEALADYNSAAQLNPKNIVIYYNRGILKQQLNDFKGSIQDFSKSIELFPEFVVAYMSRAISKDKIGDRTGAMADYSNAEDIKFRIEQNQDSTMFNRYNSSDYLAKIIEFEADFYKADAKDGRIQNKPIEITLEENYSISYLYDQLVKTEIQKRAKVNEEISHFNNYSKEIKFALSNLNLELTAEEMVPYFEIFDNSQDYLADNNYIQYLLIGVLNTTIRNYNSALDAYNKAIVIDPNNSWAYTNRANVKLKIAELANNEEDYIKTVTIGKNIAPYKDQNSAEIPDMSSIIDDITKAILLSPRSAYLYYNKANTLVKMADYEAAIQNYNKAIALDSNFAEAYFNRGLINIYLNKSETGCSDMSRAGELGIAKAYNVIKRYCK